MPFEPFNTIDWPTAPRYGSAAGFGRAVVGKFSSSSETDRDAVIVADGVAVHARVVASYEILFPITFPTQPGLTDVVDVAVLPGGGPAGTDALLATDSRGLLKTTYVAGSGEVYSGHFADPVVVAPWIDAGPIHVVDADAQGGLDIIGVAAGGTAVLTLIENGGSYTPGVISSSSTVFGAVACNFDGDPQREIVALTTAGLSVYSLAGALEFAVPYSASTGAIERVTWPDGSGTKEAIAWGRPKIGGGGELLVLNRTGIDSVLTLSVSSCQPISFVPKAILAGRYNPGAFEDLLLVHEADRSAVMLVNNEAATGSHFSLSEGWHDVIQLSASPGSPGVGLPAFDEVDGLLPEDLVFPVRATSRVLVFLNEYRHRFADPGAGEPPPTSAQVIDDQCVYSAPASPPPPTNELRIAFQVPQPYRSYPNLELVLFKEPLTSGLIEETCVNTLYTLVPNVESQFVVVQHDFPDFPWSEPRPYYYAELRFVNGTLKSPRYFMGMTLREPDDYSHLYSNAIPPLMYLYNRTSPDFPPSGTHLGAFIPMSSAPAFANGQPSLPPQTTGTADTFTNVGS